MTLKRVLGPVDSAWLVAGNMIGAGIFLTPGFVAAHLPGAAWNLSAWVLGGLLALSGAAIYGELGTRLPRAGGDYQYLTVALGPGWGFLTGWGAFLLTFSAAAAAMSNVVVEHLQAALPGLIPEMWGPMVGGPLLILLLTAANVAGARVSGRTTAVLTALPLIGLAGLFGYGMIAGEGTVRWPEQALRAPADSWHLSLGAAMLPVFFTYSGWNAAAYLAGEVRDPGRNLPRGLLLGAGLVTVLYLVINTILLAVVPSTDLAGTTTAVADAARRLLGPWSERVLATFIALAVLGSANVTLMAGARVYYAMASDGLGPQALSRTNRAGVPHAALWAGGIWSALLAATGSVSILVSWATLAILILSSATVVSLFVLRRRNPAAEYPCTGYPVTPAIYLIASAAVAIGWTINEMRNYDGLFLFAPSLRGVYLLALGLPLYALVRGRFRRNP